MLLLHQSGAVKVGEVVRYTLTYTPVRDRILPTPTYLHVRVKNTSPIPLRAAFVHGPYSLHVSAYPSTFSPHHKSDPDRGDPEYEPLLKAGAHWSCKIKVPDAIRETSDTTLSAYSPTNDEHNNNKPKSATWIIEIASQILFSSTASVHYEVLVGRDDRSLALGFAAAAAHGHGGPGKVQDHKDNARRSSGLAKGIYSKAVKLTVEDTEDLWDKPKLPSTEAKTNEFKLGDVSDEDKGTATTEKPATADSESSSRKLQQKVHLVILSHGVHSNLGADMLYLKESIDAAVRQAKDDRRKRKQASTSPCTSDTPASNSSNNDGSGDAEDHDASTAPLSGGQQSGDSDPSEDDPDEELTIVRGFSGNAIKTEKGIQYLGKRLAKYVLHFTYPDQPYVPMKKHRSFSNLWTNGQTANNTNNSPQPSCVDKDNPSASCAPSVHAGSHIHRDESRRKKLPYTFTSISFIGHSLGGLIQTYAVAYIQKHAPEFFEQIKPVNFICLASPLLGLSNENPMYVKFALDFGLVGRTGQDLGLTWRAPTLAKSGWSALVNGFTPGSKDNQQENPGSKPLLRILPTGPAHQVLRLFRNRTLYSNVVNDGIVPLRTSCLLFLDWKGLGKVDKARRENGLIGTVAEWGWAELTGATAADPSFAYKLRLNTSGGAGNGGSNNTSTTAVDSHAVPQPHEDSTELDNKNSNVPDPTQGQFLEVQRAHREHEEAHADSPTSAQSSTSHTSSLFDNLVGFFKPHPPSERSPKVPRAFRRGQTIGQDAEASSSSSTTLPSANHPEPPAPERSSSIPHTPSRPAATRGDSIEQNVLSAPPRTSIFEAAGDILHPPLPTRAWITDPASRKRTIFHDRVYHPEDIPPPPVRSIRQGRSFSTDASSPQGKSGSKSQSSLVGGSGEDSLKDVDYSRMKVEERIARAYHRDLSWRKVLVSLEPDAHNNMIVRRMFANAYGWPVVKHLCDTHFADTWSAATRDEHEPATDRAHEAAVEGIHDRTSSGLEVKNQRSRSAPRRRSGDMRQVRNELDSASPPTLDLKRPRSDGVGNAESSKPISQRASQPAAAAASPAPPNTDPDREDSEVWDDAYFEGTTEDEDEDDGIRGAINKVLAPTAAGVGAFVQSLAAAAPSDGHRGLGPSSAASMGTGGTDDGGGGDSRGAEQGTTGNPGVVVASATDPEGASPRSRSAAVFSPHGLTHEPGSLHKS